MPKALVNGRPAAEWLAKMVSRTEPEGAVFVKVGQGTPWYLPGPQTEGSVRAFVADKQLDVSVLKAKVLVSGSSLIGSVPRAAHADHLVRIANPGLAELERRDAQPASKLDMRYRSHYEHWLEREQLDPPAVVIVTGERSFNQAEVIRERIAELPQGTVIIEGETPGAARLAADVALEQGHPVAGFPPRWQPTPNTPPARVGVAPDGQRYDRAAMPIRNAKMAECHPTEVVVFAESADASKDVADMIARAKLIGVPVELVKSSGERELLAAAVDNDGSSE